MTNLVSDLDQRSDVILKLPRSAIPDVLAISESLIGRMHELLDRDADGALSDVEQLEAKTLVELAQFSQVLALSLRLA